MLARHVRIVRQQLRTRGTAESIEHFCAGPFYEMPHFERSNPRLPCFILGICIDLLTRPIKIGVQCPAKRLQSPDLSARMRIFASKLCGCLDERQRAAGPAGCGPDRPVPKSGAAQIPIGPPNHPRRGNLNVVEVDRDRVGVRHGGTFPAGRLRSDAGVVESDIQQQNPRLAMRGDECSLEESRTTAKLLRSSKDPIAVRQPRIGREGLPVRPMPTHRKAFQGAPIGPPRPGSQAHRCALQLSGPTTNPSRPSASRHRDEAVWRPAREREAQVRRTLVLAPTDPEG